MKKFSGKKAEPKVDEQAEAAAKEAAAKEAAAEYKSEWTMNNSNLSANVGIGATILGHLQAKINYNIALGKTGEVKQSGIINGVASGVKDAVNGKANAWQLSVAYLF